MPNRVTFEHKLLTGSGQHVITSPEIRGFCIVGAPGDSRSDVERQAIEMLALIQSQGLAPRGNLAAIEYEAEAA